MVLKQWTSRNNPIRIPRRGSTAGTSCCSLVGMESIPITSNKNKGLEDEQLKQMISKVNQYQKSISIKRASKFSVQLL